MQHVTLKPVNLRNHPVLNEAWLQNAIADDPSVLGLGDLVLKDRERVQPNAGRLDLLLQDAETLDRYEVEIQLGATDESHIIRTIEYWDIERRRYPQYDHTAVIVAEDITSRFLNVVTLFNGFIPIVAIQLTAIETPEGIGLQFTKVLDTVRLGLIDEDEEATEPTDRNYWQTKKGTEQTVQLADSVLEIAKQFTPSAELSYNKHYIGFRVNGKACNFAWCRPQKSALKLSIKLPQSEDTDNRLDSTDLNVLEYNKRRGLYNLKIHRDDLEKHQELLQELMHDALRQRGN